MPRIDPIQLLNCLSVLLATNGGIKSRDEVQRLASLMTKFSKKLVSKCIYIQILKRTETELLGLFMGSGGWRLVHMWLTESIVAKNWPLVRELLELLLLCPVDIERLKTNNCPKLVKELSKDDNYIAIRALASKLVEQWLKTVKGEIVKPIDVDEIPQIIEKAGSENQFELVLIKSEIDPDAELEEKELGIKQSDIKTENSDAKIEEKSVAIAQIKEEIDKAPETLPVLKITVKDGKQIISQVSDNDIKKEMSPDKEKSRDKHKSKSKEKSLDRSSSRSSSSKHSSKSHSSSSDKHKSNHRDSSSRHSSKEKSKDKDKHSSSSFRSSNSSKSTDDNKKSSDKSSSSSHRSKDERSSSKSTSDKDKSRDKSKNDKNRESSHKPDGKTPISKLGKIPKIGDIKKEKPSISIEVRKPDDPKPKTVKTFHSKFRKHGLEEEIKPPPSRASLLSKKSPVVPSTIPMIPKRPSPVHNETPPEKKPKTMEPMVEKPGAIKLIPPKPKPMMLLESDMFMDALNASATNKKEPKKRKRRTSGSKDTPGEGSPPHTPTTTSPVAESKSVPPRFYQDTLDTEEDKEKESEKSEVIENKDENKSESPKDIEEPMDTTEPHTLTINGLRGVLCYHKRKGPKKSIKWKPDTELEEIQYFELDETERVNVTKTFTDMKHLERVNERQAFQKARNLSTVDVMEAKISWRPLMLVNTEGQVQVEYGKNSKEKEVQAARQKGILSLYFLKTMVPDSPTEPEAETHIFSEPTIIPLEDTTGNQDNINDFRNTPWPEPKGIAPPTNSNVNPPSMFPPNIAQFPGVPGFPAPFPGGPGFPGPNMMPGDWQPSMNPPHMIPNGMPMNPPVMPPGAMPPINMPPGMMGPPEGMMMGPEMFAGPNPMFPVPPDGFNMPPNMFPPDFNNMPSVQGMPGADGFSAPNNMRGGMRGRGNPGHWRGKGNWEGPQRGRGGSSRGGRKTVCIYFQRKGSCRQGDSCTFLHPGVNGPF